MKTFQNPLFPKAEAVALARQHRDLDLMIRGDYKGNGKGQAADAEHTAKGCQIACMVGGNYPELLEERYGLSVSLTRLSESIFEGLPSLEVATQFHVDFWEAMPEGIDSNKIVLRFLSKMLTDPDCGAFGRGADEYLTRVSNLLTRAENGENVTAELQAARAAAWAAARATARAAEWAAARAAARATAWAAAGAAAWAAAGAAASAAARATAWAAQAKLLICVLQSFSEE